MYLYSIAVLLLPVLALWVLGFGVRVLCAVVTQLRGLHTSRRDVLDGVPPLLAANGPSGRFSLSETQTA